MSQEKGLQVGKIDSYKEKLINDYFQDGTIEKESERSFWGQVFLGEKKPKDEKLNILTKLLTDYKIKYMSRGEGVPNQKDYKQGIIYIIRNDKPVTDDNPLEYERLELIKDSKTGEMTNRVVKGTITPRDLEVEIGKIRTKEYLDAVLVVKKPPELDEIPDYYNYGTTALETRNLLSVISLKEWKLYGELDSELVNRLPDALTKGDALPPEHKSKISEYLLSHTRGSSRSYFPERHINNLITTDIEQCRLLAKCIVNNAPRGVDALLSSFKGSDILSKFPFAAQLKLAIKSNNTDVFKYLLKDSNVNENIKLNALLNESAKINLMNADLIKDAVQLGNTEIIHQIDDFLKQKIEKTSDANEKIKLTKKKNELLNNFISVSQNTLKNVMSDQLTVKELRPQIIQLFDAILKLNGDQVGPLLLRREGDGSNVLEDVLESGDLDMLKVVTANLGDVTLVPDDAHAQIKKLKKAITKALVAAITDNNPKGFSEVLSFAVKQNLIDSDVAMTCVISLEGRYILSSNGKLEPDKMNLGDYFNFTKILANHKIEDIKMGVQAGISSLFNKFDAADIDFSVFFDNFRDSRQQLGSITALFTYTYDEENQEKLIIAINTGLSKLNKEELVEVANLLVPNNLKLQKLFWKNAVKDTQVLISLIGLMKPKEIVPLVAPFVRDMDGDINSLMEIAQEIGPYQPIKSNDQPLTAEENKRKFLINTLSDMRWFNKFLNSDQYDPLLLRDILRENKFTHPLILSDWMEVLNWIKQPERQVYLFSLLKEGLSLEASFDYFSRLGNVPNQELRDEITKAYVSKIKDMDDESLKESIYSLLTNKIKEGQNFSESLKDFCLSMDQIKTLDPDAYQQITRTFNKSDFRKKMIELFEKELSAQSSDGSKYKYTVTQFTKDVNESLNIISKINRPLGDQLTRALNKKMNSEVLRDQCHRQFYDIAVSEPDSSMKYNKVKQMFDDSALGGNQKLRSRLITTMTDLKISKALTFMDLFHYFEQAPNEKEQKKFLRVFNEKLLDRQYKEDFHTFFQSIPHQTSEKTLGFLHQFVINIGNKIKEIKDPGYKGDVESQLKDFYANPIIQADSDKLIARFSAIYKLMLMGQKTLFNASYDTLYKESFLADKLDKTPNQRQKIEEIFKQIASHPGDRTAKAWELACKFNDNDLSLGNKDLEKEIMQMAYKKSNFFRRNKNESFDNIKQRYDEVTGKGRFFPSPVPNSSNKAEGEVESPRPRGSVPR